MSKLVMMRGLPASGKSTKAKEMVLSKDGYNWIRVNRDLLREMLHFDKWSPNREKTTVGVEIALVKEHLRRGRNIIVDDTNLSEKHLKLWQGVAKEAKATFEMIEMDTSVKECIDRDKFRVKKVGRSVIVGMAMQYGLYPKPDKGIVICDIDGTVADCGHRQHYVQQKPKNWPKFFEFMELDRPRYEVIEKIEDLRDEGYEVMFVSARPEEYREVTENWLIDHTAFYDDIVLFMRKDKRPDTEVKQNIYDTYFKNYDVVKVFDDRPNVIRMWRKNGLEVEDVGNGVEF